MMRAFQIGLVVYLASFSALAGMDGAMQAYERGNFAVALKTFTEKALKGDPGAQNNLAVMYANGELVKKDMELALKWYSKAAEQGLAVAQYNLGILYDEGLGTERDPGAAAVWYQLAATQGDVLAQYRLGILYADGEDDVRDESDAYFWLSAVSSSTKDPILRDDALKRRGIVAKRMTRKQIVEAELLFGAWRGK